MTTLPDLTVLQAESKTRLGIDLTFALQGHAKNIHSIYFKLSSRTSHGSGLTFALPGHAKISTQNYFKLSPRHGYGSGLTFAPPGHAKNIYTKLFLWRYFKLSPRPCFTDPVSLLTNRIPYGSLLKLKYVNFQNVDLVSTDLYPTKFCNFLINKIWQIFSWCKKMENSSVPVMFGEFGNLIPVVPSTIF